MQPNFTATLKNATGVARAFATLLVIALMTLSSAFAQETTAGLQGTIKDPSGAVIGGATVELTSPALLGARKIQTDSGGGFRFAALPSGTYTLTITAPGFRASKQTGIDLQAGRLPTLELTMQVGAVAETVEVTSTAPNVDVTQSKVAVTVEKAVLDNIPKGRSFQSVIPFAPGARSEPMHTPSAPGAQPCPCACHTACSRHLRTPSRLRSARPRWSRVQGTEY